jgi:hypothetical protein
MPGTSMPACWSVDTTAALLKSLETAKSEVDINKLTAGLVPPPVFIFCPPKATIWFNYRDTDPTTPTRHAAFADWLTEQVGERPRLLKFKRVLNGHAVALFANQRSNDDETGLQPNVHPVLSGVYVTGTVVAVPVHYFDFCEAVRVRLGNV